MEQGIGCWKERSGLLRVVFFGPKCMLAPYRRTTRHPTSFPRSDFAKAGRIKSLGTGSLLAKINKYTDTIQVNSTFRIR